MTDPFAHSDAAYVMGALDDAERGEFEAHLRTCPDCQERVADARATTALLGPRGGLGPDDLVDVADVGDVDEAPPDTLLPALLRRARREQVRRRGLASAIGVVAAACLVALVVAVWPGHASAPRPQAMQAVRPVSFVTATAALQPRAWGTEIDVRCKYANADPDAATHAYGLRVVDRAGHSYPAGTWTVTGDETVAFTGGTEVRRERIAKVQVVLTDGTPVLQLTV